MDHCRTTAHYAAQQSGGSLKHCAYLAGLLHDMGKFTLAFQSYLEQASRGVPVRRGSVNHTFAGVRFALERWHTATASLTEKLTSEFIAYAIGGHHGQFDLMNPDGKDGFLHRIQTEETGYEEAKEHFLLHCAAFEELDECFSRAEGEVCALLAQFKTLVTSDEQLRFYFSLTARDLLSTVMDGDRRDTAEFMLSTSMPPPPPPEPTLWRSLLSRMEERYEQFSNDSPINQARRSISEQCAQAATRESGMYRLSVPTGGGKTLSGLRYALAAAACHGKERIFFVSSLLTVLEQNAGVIRDWVSDDRLILEHHSNLVQEQDDEDEQQTQKLLTETWDAPIIITTLVQLLQTLFSGKTSSIRRMQALRNSVLIIDEVQTVPRHMLTLFNLAMNYLSQVCHASIVFTSATQPSLDAAHHPIAFSPCADIVPYDEALWQTFRRTQIIDHRKAGGYSEPEITDFALSCAREEGNLLLICNTKAQARNLFQALSQRSDLRLFHLSTSMCMAHRRETLDEINACLARKEPTICVSTQLVEAGVDFSFACVIRICAGLDNVIQAAGRCNRNGEIPRLCPVYILNMQGENLSYLKEIQQAQTAAEAVLIRIREQPERFQNDISSDSAIQAYYHQLYANMPSKSQDYYVKAFDTTLYSLLSANRSFCHRSATGVQHVLTQAFRTAGDTFCVFDDATIDILVPYQAGKDIILALGSEEAKHNLNLQASLFQRAKAFSISIYEHERRRLAEAGALFPLCDGAVLTLQEGYYCESMGLNQDGALHTFLEL